MSTCQPRRRLPLAGLALAGCALVPAVRIGAQSVPASSPPRAPAAAGSFAPLSADEKILLVLDRFTFGLRPGDLERVRAVGLGPWLKQQLDPNTIDDSVLERRLDDYPAVQLPLQKMLEMYPTPAMVRAAEVASRTADFPELNGAVQREG